MDLSSRWSQLARRRLCELHDSNAFQRENRIRAGSVRNELDHELAELHALVNMAKSVRNTTVAISVLPPEILANIFERCAENEPMLSPHRHSVRTQRLGWVKITHVCRFWRGTALEHPSLWATISFSLPQCTQELVVRSRSAPVILEYFATDNGHRGVIAQIRNVGAQCASRISRIRLRLPEADLTPLVSIILHRMPLLKSLTLETTGGFTLLGDIQALSSSWNLALNQLHLNAPKLQEITIRAPIALPWNSPIFCNLTRLEVDYPELELVINRRLCPPLPLIVQTLREMRNIRVLSLQNAVSIPSHGTDTGCGPPVHLHHLDLLRLSGPLSSVAPCLEHILVPFSTVLDISINRPSYYPSPTDHNSSLLLPLLNHRLSFATKPVPAPSCTLSVPVSGNMPYGCISKGLIRQYPGESLRSISLCQAIPDWYLDSSKYLQTMDELEEIEVVGEAFAGDCLLQTFMAAHTTCPKLRMVTIRSNRISLPLAEAYTRAFDACFSSTPLPILRIVGCTVHRSWLESLRQMGYRVYIVIPGHSVVSMQSMDVDESSGIDTGRPGWSIEVRNRLTGLQSQNAVGEVLTELRSLLAYTGNVYNSKALINVLPPEILFKIFGICANLEGQLPPSMNRASYPTKDLLTVTRVCRHWRDVALAVPQPLGSDRSAPSSRMDGGTAAASAHGAARHPRARPIVELGMQSLRVPHGNINIEWLVSDLQRPFPLLASVTIRGQYDREASLVWTRILDDLGQNAPSLRNLTTYSLVAAPWNSCKSLRGLTSLSVKLPRLDRIVNDDGDTFDHAYATPAQLLDMLREIPLLESLELQYCISLIPTSTEDCVLRLPNLRFLHMAGRAYPLSSLLRHLILSPAAQVRLTVDVPEKGQDVFSQLTYHANGSLPLTLPSVEGPSGVPTVWQSLKVFTDTAEFLQCHARHGSAPLGRGNAFTQPPLVLRFAFSVFSSFHSSCEAIVRLFPAAELRVFSVSFDLFPSWWTSYAQNMSHLKTIEFLNNNAASTFMRWMSMTPQYLPELQELWFRNVDFRVEDLAEVGLIALKARARHRPLSVVVLHDCRISDAWLDIVAEMKHVRVVEWGGKGEIEHGSTSGGGVFVMCWVLLGIMHPGQ
ncbi:hypothetical protein EVG20_g8238 [Dentipellis fragilis]|uniref:F-box domain-containing protein n=1 Tax=Dentipellis fragilis TaxID=205917 RepID=A0A4Y9Y6S5_9AGAM|nr:hypothetical protein EVG20_g8238 [Dentipellis fragilis]